MSPPTIRQYFVLTLRGDRGPLDRDGVNELVRSGEATPTDHVRNAFGRSLGTVADVLAGRERGPTSDRMRSTPGPQRSSVLTRPAPGIRVLTIIACVVIVAAVAVVATIAMRNAPRPPDAPPTKSADNTHMTPLTQPPPPSAPDTRIQQPAPPVVPPRSTATPAPSAPVAIAPKVPTDPVAKPEPLPTAPEGWLGYNIGGGPAGSGPDIIGNTWTVCGSGRLSWTKDPDGCRFGATTLAGDGMITARVLSVEPTNEGYAGLMLRGDTRADGARVVLYQSSVALSTMSCLDYRAERGAHSIALNRPFDAFGTSPHQWLRLMRRGTIVSAWISKDGSTWLEYGTMEKNTAFAGPVLVGIAAFNTPDTARPMATAVFSDVVVGPLPPEPTPRTK